MEEMLARAEELDLAQNVFQGGVWGTLRCAPLVATVPHACPPWEKSAWQTLRQVQGAMPQPCTSAAGGCCARSSYP